MEFSLKFFLGEKKFCDKLLLRTKEIYHVGRKKRPLEEIKDVMVIEDETDVSETLEMYLNNMDCFRNIIHSYDGTTAINKLPISHFLLSSLTSISQEEAVWMFLNILQITKEMKLRMLLW